MLSWLISNLATVLICLVLIGAVISAIAVLVRDHKKGKSSCGGGCQGCPMSGSCHKR